MRVSVFNFTFWRDLRAIAIGRRNRICRSDRQFFEPGRDSGIQIQLRQAILKLARANESPSDCPDARKRDAESGQLFG